MNNVMEQDIKKVLISEEEIREKVAEIGARISEDYAGKNLLMVGILKGSVVFMADLMRAVTTHARIDFMSVSSYGSGTKSSGVVKIVKDLDNNVEGYDLLLVEDILDDYTLFLHRGGGAFLRRYREAKGWNRQQLADHAKVSRTSIRCWESGQKTISQKCFCHLVENLGSDFPSMLRM